MLKLVADTDVLIDWLNLGQHADRLLQVDRSLDDPVQRGHGVPPAYPPLTGGKTAISSRPVSARSARA